MVSHFLAQGIILVWTTHKVQKHEIIHGAISKIRKKENVFPQNNKLHHAKRTVFQQNLVRNN